MSNMTLIEKILRYFFKDYYRKMDEHAAFIKKFPCPDCRPDLECTFYYDIPCTCATCGREYHI